MLPPQTTIYLVEPDHSLSYEFAALRNELKKSEIPFVQLIGFEKVQEMMNDKVNRNLILINSSKFVNIPKEVFKVYKNQIYLYPKAIDGFRFQRLENPKSVKALYNLSSGTVPTNRPIKLRSIKKDLERSQQRRQYDQMYDRVILMHPKGYNNQYEQLFSVLEGYRQQINPINRENQLQQYKSGKSLLILQKDSLEAVNNLLIQNRLDKSIDLAILGKTRGFDKANKNYAIISEDPYQILTYLDESGLKLNGVRQKLMKGKLAKKNSTDAIIENESKPMRNKFIAEENQFVAQNHNMNGQAYGNMNINQNGGEVVTYSPVAINSSLPFNNGVAKTEVKTFEQGQIPQSSKISDKASEKSKKSVRKVKKVEKSNSSQAGSVIRDNSVIRDSRDSNSQTPAINVKTVDTDSESSQIRLNNQINFQQGGNLAEIPINKKQSWSQSSQKPVMHWQIYPDKNKKSQFSNSNIPLFILQSDRQNMPSAMMSQKLSEARTQTRNPAVPLLITNSTIPEVTQSNITMGTQPGPIPPKPPSVKSKDSIQDLDSMNSIRSSKQFQAQNKIQQKYGGKTIEIKQLSQQNRGSNLSHTIDELRIASQLNKNNRSQSLPASEQNTTAHFSQIGQSSMPIAKFNRPISFEQPKIISQSLATSNVITIPDVPASPSPPINTQIKRVEQKQTINPVLQGQTVGNPINKILRNQVPTIQTYYQTETQKTITNMSTNSNTNPNLNTNTNIQIKPSITETQTTEIYKTNPHKLHQTYTNTSLGMLTDNKSYTPINSVLNLATSNVPVTLTNNYSQPLHTHSTSVYSQSPIVYAQPTTVYRDQSNTQTAQRSSVLNNPAYASINQALTTSLSPNPNYMSNMGIPESKYEVITDSNGIKRYKLKQSFTTNPVKTSQTLTRYKSQPKYQVQVETTTHTIANNNTITNNSNRQKVNQPINITNNISTTPQKLNLFNWEDYDEHVDERGRKYYTVKKNNSATPRTSTQLLTQSKSVERLQPAVYNYNSPTNYTQAQTISNYTPTHTYTSSNYISPNNYPANRYQSPNSLSIQNKLSPATQNSHRKSRVIQSTHEQYKSKDGQVKTYQDHKKQIQPETGKLIKTNIRQSVSPNSFSYQQQLIQETPNSHKEIYRTETKSTAPYLHTNTYPHTNTNTVTTTTQRVQSYSSSSKPFRQAPLQQKNSQFYSYDGQTSGLSRDSLLTDSRPSGSKMFNAHLYGDSKPYYIANGNFIRVEGEELARITHDLRNLDTRNNFVHFIIQSTHPYRNAIMSLAGAQDKITTINSSHDLSAHMNKQALPNDFYDLGLIFLTSPSSSSPSITKGYYLCNVNPQSPQIQIRKQLKVAYMHSINNVEMLIKLLLAPLIHHYIFYPKGNDADVNKIIALFPSAKFQKFSYSARGDLQSLLNIHLRNKGRLCRVLIFVNPTNIHEIAPLMEHSLNYKTFTMICNNRQANDSLKNKYQKVSFANNFDFGSYGSVMNLGMNSSDYPIDASPTMTYFHEPSISNQSHQDIEYRSLRENNVNDNRPRVYIQHPHKGIDKLIQKAYPGMYAMQYFTSSNEITSHDRDNFILLHREADNVGSTFDRNMGTLIMLGGLKGDRIPSGTVSIGSVEELIENIL